MNIFIPNIKFPIKDKRNLFILTRPFYSEKAWTKHSDVKSECKLNKDFNCTDNIANAQIILIPFSINTYFEKDKANELEKINVFCVQYNIKAFGFIEGDFGIAFPEFSNITYFRMGGFKKQLSDKNKGFPVSLSDHFQRLFHQETIVTFPKKKLPVVGFCGHANTSSVKRLKEIVKCLLENSKRFLKKPFRKDFEPLFASAYERAKLLNRLEQSNKIETNFIYRKNYRGGAITETQREATTLEYYQNIYQSDYVLCVRGAGNFSVRLYETLMLGKIPIFVDTDCLLPFEEIINWKNHVIWIDWKDRKDIATIVSDFHNQLSEDDFVKMQLDNRQLWKETLSVKGMLEMISNDI
ncbi:MAG: exostosin family protein [Flavobacterium sp.]|uniref:exostosin domain-containing protein n=1 Tax=Flavobacterium sp. TaxID=239 RepID=UPI003262D404